MYVTHLYFTNEELTGYKGSWMNPVNRCCLTHSFFNSLFFNKKNCLWSWVKQEREIDSMPLTQEMMAKERSKFLAKQSTGWCGSFPCPILPNQKVLKKVCQVIKPFSFQGDKLRGWSISPGEVHGNSFCSAWCTCHPRAATYAGSATKALQPFRKDMVWGKVGGEFEWGEYALPGWSGPCSPIRKKWGLEESFLFSALYHCLWLSEIMSRTYGFNNKLIEPTTSLTN